MTHFDTGIIIKHMVLLETVRYSVESQGPQKGTGYKKFQLPILYPTTLIDSRYQEIYIMI